MELKGQKKKMGRMWVDKTHPSNNNKKGAFYLSHGPMLSLLLLLLLTTRYTRENLHLNHPKIILGIAMQWVKEDISKREETRGMRIEG